MSKTITHLEKKFRVANSIITVTQQGEHVSITIQPHTQKESKLEKMLSEKKAAQQQREQTENIKYFLQCIKLS